MKAKPKPRSRARLTGAWGRARRTPAWLRLPLLALAAALAVPASGQPTPAQGRLLVATPEIDDSSWSQTVMLVLHHDSNGTLGIAVNRPTLVAPQEVAPALGELPGYEAPVFRGGPVGPTQMIFLARNPPPELLESAPMIVDGVYAAGDLSVLPRLAEAADGDRELRLYAGHAEWAPGQLEQEIAGGRWTVVDGSAERVFSPDTERLWQLLQALGDELLVQGPAGPRAAAAPEARAALSRSGRASRPAASTSPR